MKTTECIGTCEWWLNLSLESTCYMGVTFEKAGWANPNTHPSELYADMRDSGFETHSAECRQWQKVGRQIKQVVIARFVLLPNGEWKAVPADAQPLPAR